MAIIAQAADSADSAIVSACGESPGFLCRQVFEWTQNGALAKAADWVLDRPIRIMFVLLLAWIASSIAKRAIVRMAKRIGSDASQSHLKGIRHRGLGRILDDTQRSSRASALDRTESSRASARAETLGYVLRSLALSVIWSLAAMIVLGEVGVNLGPLIAGAGIAGVALGFGAQSVVKDFLAGLFMLIEDHYGVGDMIEVNGVMGNVEEVSLRSTAFRDRNGTVWHVPNGQIDRVANFSQMGLRARINLEVAYNADLRQAIRVINRVGEDMWDSELCRDKLVGPPQVSGIQELRPSAVAIRAVVETVPALEWPKKRRMEREFRLRIKEAFDANGIEMPFPQKDVWMRTDDPTPPGAGPSTPAPSTLEVITDGHFEDGPVDAVIVEGKKPDGGSPGS